MSSNTPYDDVFRTLLDQCPQLAIPLINELFGESYPSDTPIVLRQNEHFLDAGGTAGRGKKGRKTKKGEKCISDSNILMMLPGGSMTFHIECQSTTDRSMVLRMFKYDVAIAAEDADRSQRDWLPVRLPRSGVVYLRKDPAGPSGVRFINQVSGKVDWQYSMGTISATSYSLDELFARKLLILVPYHLFAHERRLAHYNEDDEALAGFLEECGSLRDRLEGLALSGEIDEFTKRTVVDMTIRVAESLARKFNRVVEGVRQVMGGQVLEYEARTIRDESKAEGKAEGRIETLAELVSSGIITLDQAAGVAGMTVEEFERAVAAVA